MTELVVLFSLCFCFLFSVSLILPFVFEKRACQIVFAFAFRV